jgi:hypothetical protein
MPHSCDDQRQPLQMTPHGQKDQRHHHREILPQRRAARARLRIDGRGQRQAHSAPDQLGGDLGRGKGELQDKAQHGADGDFPDDGQNPAWTSNWRALRHGYNW